MKVGSLCTGILGLDRAVLHHFSGTLAWYSEVEPAPCTVVEREHPGVPNLGDLKLIDWASCEPVDILTAGYPCQPFSHAGKRKGTDDPRHLWPYIIEGARVLRPRHLVLENVRGHLSLGFDTVLGDLAEAGFDAEWCLLRASDVGAPHQRARIFIVATDTRGERRVGRSGVEGEGRDQAERGEASDHAGDSDPARRAPSSDARRERHGGGQDGGAVGRVDRGDAGEARQRQRAWEVAGDRSDAAPADAEGKQQSSRPRSHDAATLGLATAGAGSRDRSGDSAEGVQGLERGAGVEWGQYAPAIRRWEHVLGRCAPRPVDDAGRLSPHFIEWMMGYPEGWTADLNRTAALKALGNAVVTQQALAALRELAHLEERAA